MFCSSGLPRRPGGRTNSLSPYDRGSTAEQGGSMTTGMIHIYRQIMSIYLQNINIQQYLHLQISYFPYNFAYAKR